MKKIVILFSLFSTLAHAADDTLGVKRWSPFPVKVNKLKQCMIDLGGSWYFNPSPEKGFEKALNVNEFWSKIQVPGEWVMQGFTVKPGTWAGYSRSFEIPADWKNERIKIRCDAVYSESDLYINGQKAGYHLGGFTPFEFDITGFVKAGSTAVITIKVRNESIADSLASGSRYAVHQLGGITRKIQLVAVPDVNLSLFHATTLFDKQYANAVLKTEIQVANESSDPVKKTSLFFELLKAGSNEIVVSKRITQEETLQPGNILNKTIEIPVERPKKWDPEHPYLYTFRLTLEANGKTEVTERKIGFRQIEVRNNKLYVNNMPVKTRGVCRHEVSPLRGRSLSGDQWKEDVQIFIEGNVNFIRTSHYPPAEEFINACDSLGMFVEAEAPFCWANETEVPEALYKAAILDQTMDMVNQLKSHPSILTWSLANESQEAYKKYFRKSGELVKAFDPSRPRIYEQYGNEQEDGELELSNQHYPGPKGPSQYANNKRPMSFGEYSHLNAYNRLELLTDPGIRDAWGIGLNNMWEKMYAAPSLLGGALWAGIDDTFILPDGKVVGYGTWGPIDGWRRRKPEFWHMKKIYSPVKISITGNYRSDSIQMLIENRLLFSNLNECTLQWKAGKYSGILQPSIPAGNKSLISIKINGQLRESDTLFMDVFDPRKILIDQYAFEVVPEIKEEARQQQNNISEIIYTKTAASVTAGIAGFNIVLDKRSGAVNIIENDGKRQIAQLGQLIMLPLNGDGRGTQMTGEVHDFKPITDPCRNRVVKKIEFTALPEKFDITVYDDYDEASGFVRYEITGDNRVAATYRYTVKADINPRQWGLCFTAAEDFNTLSWKRNGLWNYYPADHIGRLSGKADALSAAPVSGPAGPVQLPAVSWSQDRNELGTNDFRSTKMNITEGALQCRNSSIKIISDGSQHLRAWKEGSATRLLIAGYSNLGAERFFRGHAERFDKPLKQGDVIGNTVHLSFQ